MSPTTTREAPARLTPAAPAPEPHDPLSASALFDDLVDGELSAADAPEQITLPGTIADGMDRAWDRTLRTPGGREHGGTISRDPDGGYGWTDAPKGKKGSLTLPAPKEGEDRVGVGHTHPRLGFPSFKHQDWSFSGQDLSVIARADQRVMTLRAADTNYLIGRTQEFDARFDALKEQIGEDEARQQLGDQIAASFEAELKAAKGSQSKRIEAAVRATCDTYGLLYYAGEGQELTHRE